MSSASESNSSEAGYEAVIRAHEIEATAELLRAVVHRHPKLQPLPSGRFMIGYGPDRVWLSVSGVTVAQIDEPQWWEAGLGTREDRAVELAAQLARATKLLST